MKGHKMKIKEKVSYKVYEWDFEKLGLFRATINDDGTIIDLRFCDKESGLERALYAPNKDYLRAVYKALKDLFKEVFKEE